MIHRYIVTDLTRHTVYHVYAVSHMSAVQGVVIMHFDSRALIVLRLSGKPEGPGKFQAYLGPKPLGPEFYVE